MAGKMKCDCKPWSLMAVRVVLGLVFLIAGWAKIKSGDVSGFAGMLASTWWPFGHTFFAWVVAIFEVVFGAFLVLGVWTRWSAVPLAFISFVAMLMKWTGGFGSTGFMSGWNAWRFDLLMIAAFAVLYYMGGGKWSLDSLWKKK